MFKFVLGVSMMLALSACQPESPTAPAAAPDTASAATPKPSNNVLQTQMDALQKAKDVQQQMDQQAKERAKELDAATGQ